MAQRSKPDGAALLAAYEALVALPFPPHPEDDALGAWMLDLVELDGYVAGLAVDALGSGRPVDTGGKVAAHGARLAGIRPVGEEDRTIHAACVRYVGALQRIEDLLRGPGRLR